jgi:hypothetical protein
MGANLNKRVYGNLKASKEVEELTGQWKYVLVVLAYRKDVITDGTSSRRIYIPHCF